MCLVDVGEGQVNLGLAAYAESCFGDCGCPAAEQTRDGPPPALEPVLCSECVEKKVKKPKLAEASCKECGDRAYCSAHAVAHEVEADHALVPLVPEGLGAPVNFAVKATCSKHVDGVLRYFCMTDKMPVCADCVIDSHPKAAHDVRDLAGAADELTTLLRDQVGRVHAGVSTSASSAAAVRAALEEMKARFDSSCAAFTARIDRLTAALAAHRDTVLKDATALHRERVKALEAQLGVFMISSGQLDAVSHFCKTALDSRNVLSIARAVQSVSSMQSAVTPQWEAPAGTRFVEIVCDADQWVDKVNGLSRVKQQGIDGAKCVVSGPGLEVCVRGEGDGALARNVVAVACVDDDGRPAVDVTPHDVELSVRRASTHAPSSGGAGGDSHTHTPAVGAVVKRAMKHAGVIEFVYTVSSDYDGDEVRLDVKVSSCGQPLKGSPYHVRCPAAPSASTPGVCVAAGRLVAAFPVLPANKFGMAVSPDDKRAVVVAHGEPSTITVYDVATGAVVCAIGGQGNGPCRLLSAGKLCFAPNGNMLICDQCNHRVQEVTVAGVHVRNIAVGYPWTICTNGTVIVVGNARGRGYAVEVYDFTRGTVLNSFGPFGATPGAIGSQCEGLRITPDGKHVLVAEYSNTRLSLFTLEGVFVKHIGAGVVANGYKDVEFAANGDIIVADSGNHRICVFSADGSTLLRCWGTQGPGDGQFQAPCALAVRGARLYVLERSGHRVQVFE